MASKKQDSTTSSSSSEAISSQRPVTDNVSSSLSLYNDDSDQDLNVVPHQLSEDSSDRRLRRVEQRKLRKKRGKASPKVKCTSAFYKRNVWLHNSSIHYTLKCVDVAYSPLVSDDDSDIVALSDNDIIVHGRDTPYSPPASDENTESDDSTADLFAQMYETYPDSE